MVKKRCPTLDLTEKIKRLEPVVWNISEISACCTHTAVEMVSVSNPGVVPHLHNVLVVKETGAWFITFIVYIT